MDQPPKDTRSHEQHRVLSIRGKSFCNSACVFCVEKFSSYHPVAPRLDEGQHVRAASQEGAHDGRADESGGTCDGDAVALANGKPRGRLSGGAEKGAHGVAGCADCSSALVEVARFPFSAPSPAPLR